ncbi:DUF4056 domain-containing protein [Enterobacillus tribolii]|uniref:Uncharacterized protein DUF4056 n=1 Tax=Enterobacillus tribolii TaxID=1487935 RepID=A0A370QAU4_9GAMM|nr:uncharacterized protein DUF4056 [Enterobacillus tribolii]
MRIGALVLGSLLLIGCQGQASSTLPILPDLHTRPQEKAARVWPVAPPLSTPDGLRPCCAFGYNLQAQALGIPVPFYMLGNVVEADSLGEHHYNDSMLGAVANLMGLSSEVDGLLYTRRGGFIDLAHVRDTADYTLFLFTHIWPRLGLSNDITLGNELGERRIVLKAFTAPSDPVQRYQLAAALAARLAFQLAAWHEVAQWYGYESVPGFSEGVSAFSPEDLYSNLLGARLAISVILAGHASSLENYNLAMQRILPQALHTLEAVPAVETRFHFDMLDGNWWNSHRRLPDKYLVLFRNYQTGDNRLPSAVPGEKTPPLRLQLADNVGGFSLDELGELQIWPGSSMKNLPPPIRYYTYRDFPALALHARAVDARELSETR